MEPLGLLYHPRIAGANPAKMMSARHVQAIGARRLLLDRESTSIVPLGLLCPPRLVRALPEDEKGVQHVRVRRIQQLNKLRADLPLVLLPPVDISRSTQGGWTVSAGRVHRIQRRVERAGRHVLTSASRKREQCPRLVPARCRSK